MNREEHWNRVYEIKGPDDISWYQAKPAISMRPIAAAGVSTGEPIVDVGSGTSLLIDCLLDAGFNDLTVLGESTWGHISDFDNSSAWDQPREPDGARLGSDLNV